MHIGQFPPVFHLALEALAFWIGGALYFRLKKKDTLTENQRPWIIVGGCLGAAIFSKLFFWLEDPQWFVQHITSVEALMMGKSLVGALIGGWIGIETAKKIVKVQSATGDSWVIPLAVGIMVGRLGCFLTGFYDRTYGTDTTMPFGVDFGDGVLRHPLQLYEITWLAGLIGFLTWRAKKPYQQGDLWKLFIIGYMTYRFFAEFLKPVPHVYFGLDVEQVAAICVYLYYWRFITSRCCAKPSADATT